MSSIATTRRSIRISRGGGRTLTDEEGRYRFVTIKPGAYPLDPITRTRGVPRTSISPPSAKPFLTRLVTQMDFPGDPLLPFDPVLNGIPDAAARERLVSTFDWDSTLPEHALGYRFDMVLRGRDATPWEK